MLGAPENSLDAFAEARGRAIRSKTALSCAFMSSVKISPGVRGTSTLEPQEISL